MRVSVVMETYNAGEDGAGLLARALACLAAQSRAADEIILVDGGGPASEALRATAAQSPLPRARWIDAPGGGYYDQKNAGAAAATGDVIAFLDSDTEIVASWIATATATLAAGGDAVVTGRTVYEGPGRIPLLSTIANFGDVLGRDRRRTPRFYASNVAFRSDAWRALGGFRPGIGRCAGCVLLSARIRERGLGIRCEPALVSRHHFEPGASPAIALQLRFGFTAWKARRLDRSIRGAGFTRLGPLAPLLVAAGLFLGDLRKLAHGRAELGIGLAGLPAAVLGLLGLRTIAAAAVAIATLRPRYFTERYGW